MLACFREAEARSLKGHAPRSITLPTLSSGTHMLTAVYEGNSDYEAANSPQLKEVVK